MNIGFIGAGKMGFTLGKHLADHGFTVAGYCSKSESSAQEAARFTASAAYPSLESIAQACDMLFLTVPDGAIAGVWEQLKDFNLQDKIVCHTSGALSSDVFAGIREQGAFGYSVHPLFPINSKLESYEDIPRALIAIEGHEEHLDLIRQMFEQMGHVVVAIDKDVKVRYHAAAVFASNLVVGLYARAQEMLVSCGFTREQAASALEPIFLSNCRNILDKGPEGALTGPAERCDTSTIAKHLEVLDRHERDIYLSLSEELACVAQRKNPERDYAQLAELLQKASRPGADS